MQRCGAPSISCSARRRRAANGAPRRTASVAPGGYIVLAMGKYGAGELNYSSDIDLIVFFDRDRIRLAPGVEAEGFFVRLTRDLVQMMSERTGDGYVFRTDLRLRPDAGATQIALSTAAALIYYESFGQNWERAALIKARACAGDIAAGEELLGELAPFIWRKYLDYAAIADVHAMKRQIHAHRGFGRHRRRRPQHQARPRRHPRDRVLRADAAADRRRAPAGAARTADARRRWTSSSSAAGSSRTSPASWARPTSTCGASSTACRWSPTSRRTRCRTIPRSWKASRGSAAMPIRRRSRGR